MKICVVTPDYPDKSHNVYSFVKQLVDEFADQGHVCYVISTYNICQKKSFHKFIKSYKTKKGNIVNLIRPNYVSFSTLKIKGISVSEYMQTKAVEKAFRNLPIIPEVIYCHFWKSGLLAYKFAKVNNIPLFVASGESVIKNLFSCSSSLSSFYEYVSGVICVSTKNKNESINLGLTTESKCIVLPNSINDTLFHKMDKQWCRKEIQVPDGIFIVVFVGWFNERKGARRVSKAIEKLNNPNIHALFLGEGEDEPTCDNILVKKKIPHEELPIYLNAADVFVLPTKNEGCCNAIIEAMACGLPIVSSDLPFNWDVLNKDNSILIDPDDIDALSLSIGRIYSDVSLRRKIGTNALRDSAKLTLSRRASSIIDFIIYKSTTSNSYQYI